MATKIPVLIMLQGKEPGSRYGLPENRITAIGRSSQNQISLLSPTVSRFHCEIAYINGKWHIHDLNSRLGTFVNDRLVSQRSVLNPGDIIRISSNVFRFDLVDEKAEEEDRLVGIQEAILDKQLRVKGESVASLDDVRKRSLIEVGARQEEKKDLPRRLSPALTTNIAFVAAAAAVVALCVSGVLAYGSHRAQKQRQLQNETFSQAEGQYASAVALLDEQPPRMPEAIRLLRALMEDHPDTPAAGKAADKLLDIEWQYAESELEQISKLEAQQLYRDAATRYKALSDLCHSLQLRELVALRLDFLERLARVALRQVQEQADRSLAGEGGPEAARALYEKARETLGIPSLASEIEERLGSIGTGG